MKRRLIINIENDDIDDATAAWLVLGVIRNGRKSETAGRAHYAHISTSGSKTIRAFKRTDTTDTFTIWRE